MLSPISVLKKIPGTNRFDCRALARTIIPLLTFLLAGAHLSANSVISWGRQVIPPLEEMDRLIAMSAGEGFNVAIQSGGRVIAWGANNYRQATIPPELSDVIAVAAGSTHALALRADGSVIGWGNDREQQATVPADLKEAVAISAGRTHSVALHADGSISAWGQNRHGQLDLPTDAGEVAAISAGLYHNLALRRDGTVFAWGLNEDGQSSVPEDLSDIIAVAAGGFHSLALRSDGVLVGWGNNDFAQASFPEQITGIRSVQAGEDHNIVLLESGRIIVWGRNHYGQVSAPVDLAPGSRIAAGAHHSVVLLKDGSLKAWGRNDHGQALNPADLSSVTSISAWDNHTVALRRDGTILWWGINLATGIQPDQSKLQSIVAVAAGRAHGLALRSNGTIVGWGDNLYGQASPPRDLRNVVAIAAGEFHSLALQSNGTVAAWGNNFQGQTLVPRRLDKVIAIAGGQEHSMALRHGGMIFCWGDDFHGQLRTPASVAEVIAFASGNFHNLALQSNGTLTGWGSDLFGQVAVPDGLSDVVAMAGSRSHSVGIRENRILIGWGSNHYGQADVPPDLGPVISVAAGNGRTVVVTGELQPPRFAGRLESLATAAGEDIFILPRIEGTPPFHYQWMKDGTPVPGANGPALYLPAVGALDSGSYSLILANRVGNSTSRSFSIEVEDPSVQIAVNPTVAVLDQSATFTAEAKGDTPIRYQWTRDGEAIPGANERRLVLEQVHEDHTGLYAVEVSNQHGTTSSETIQFLIEPRIEGQLPETAIARIGERLTLAITASGSPPLEVQWLKDGLPIRDATNQQLVLENIDVSDGGVYSAVVSNAAGRVKSESTLLQIIPHIVFQPESQVFSAFGGTAAFEVRATGTPPLAYQWMKNGQLLARTPDPRLVLNHVQASDAGEYHVVVVNEAGQVESERASLMVPPAISRHPQSVTIRAGEGIELTAQAIGTEPFTFQWFKNGEPIAGEQGPALHLEKVEGKDSARYSVTISNEVGFAASQEGMLSISPNISTPPEANAASSGDAVSLRVEADGSQPLFYQWTRNGLSLPDARQPSLDFPSIKPDDAGFYSVIVSNAAGIAISDHVEVKVD